MSELEAIQQLQDLCDNSSFFDDQQLVPRLFDCVSVSDSVGAPGVFGSASRTGHCAVSSFQQPSQFNSSRRSYYTPGWH